MRQNIENLVVCGGRGGGLACKKALNFNLDINLSATALEIKLACPVNGCFGIAYTTLLKNVACILPFHYIIINAG